MAKDSLSKAVQETLLVILCFQDQNSRYVRSVVDLSHFESSYREIAKACYSYIDRYGEAPKDHIDETLDYLIESDDSKKAYHYAELLTYLHQAKDSVNARYALDRLNQFVRHQSLKRSILEAVDLLQGDDENATDRAEKIILDGVKTRADVFEPGTVLSDYSRSLRFLDDEGIETFPTGIKEIDYRGLGPKRGGMHLFMAPRKAGKCLPGDTRVLLPDGRYIPIKRAVEEKVPEAVAVDETTHQFVRASIEEHYDNGEKQCVEVTTRTGRRIEATTNHPFLTLEGWKNVEELSEGDRIAVPKYLNFFGRAKPRETKVRLLAYLIANGSLGQRRAVQFTSTYKELQQDFQRCVRDFGDEVGWLKDNKSAAVVNSKDRVGKHYSNNTVKMIEDYGLSGKKAAQKFLPDDVYTWNKKKVALFLNILFTCDGWFSPKEIGYSSASSELIDGVQHLLLRFGLIAKRRRFTAKCNGREFYHEDLTISARQDLWKFIKEIGFSFHKAHLRPEKGVRPGKASYLDNYPRDWVDARYGLHYDHKYDPTNTLSVSAVRRYAEKCGDEKFANPDVLWDPIVSIQQIGSKHTYDLTVKGHHNFVANDVVAHNTHWLVNLAKRAMLRRYRVCHITLEMSEAEMSQRYMQSLFAIPKRQANMVVKSFATDNLGRLSRIDQNVVTPQFSLQDPDAAQRIKKKADKFASRLKNIVIRQFPTGTLTVQGLAAYLDMLEDVRNFIPDLLILDYGDLMKVNADNLRIDLGNVFKDLRGLAVERNIALATATQAKEKVNRASVSALRMSRRTLARSPPPTQCFPLPAPISSVPTDLGGSMSPPRGTMRTVSKWRCRRITRRANS